LRPRILSGSLLTVKRPSRRRIIIYAVVAFFLLVLLVGPFLVPIGQAEGTVPSRELADPDSRFVDMGGVVGTERLDVHYKEAGTGEPGVVLLHGFGGSTFSWRDVLPGLAREQWVVAFDRPGFGLTSRPLPGEWSGDSPYSMESQVALTVEMMDELGLEQAVLVGHSAGAAVALQTALAHPERVKALVLVAPAVYGGGPPSWVKPLLRVPQIRRLGPLIARRLVGSLESVLERSYADPSRITEEVREGYKKPLRVDDWDRGLWEFTLAADDGGLADRLGEVSVPTLVVTGDADGIVSPDDSKRVAAAIPGAKLVVVTEAGHLVMEERPDEFLGHLRRFLEGL
jgi:pimeloyl-ACP methyl ester carboxylesterase